jgi:hypothetical protein
VPEQSTISNQFNRELDEDQRHSRRDYGSNQRPRHRQGDGNDQDQNFGTNSLNEGNMAGSLSWGYDNHRGRPEENRDRRYNPMSGSINRDPGRDRDHRDHPRGGYDSNNRNPNDRNKNR